MKAKRKAKSGKRKVNGDDLITRVKLAIARSDTFEQMHGAEAAAAHLCGALSMILQEIEPRLEPIFSAHVNPGTRRLS